MFEACRFPATAASALVFCLAAGTTGALAQAVPLAPHRAVYDLTMIRSSGNNAPVSARGRIVFDFNGSACEGYAVQFRQVTEMQASEGEAFVSDMRSATFESADHRTFDFKIDTSNNGRTSESIDGRAIRSRDGVLALTLRQPKPTKLDLARDVVFPTEQIFRILNAARAGQRTAAMDVFDGSDNGQKIYATMAVIGNELKSPPTEDAARIEAMNGVRRWPVVVSFFDVAKAAETPSYTLGFDLYENGISGALRLDYGNFVMKGEMTTLEVSQARPCPR